MTPTETVLHLPAPPSVNRTRKWHGPGQKKFNDFCEAADKLILWTGGMRQFKRINGRFEAVLTLNDDCRLDLDNAAKAAIDYAKRIGLIVDDGPKYMRKLTIEWGPVPHGCRLRLVSVA